MLRLLFSVDATHQQLSRDIKQIPINSLDNLNHGSTVTLSFETYSEKLDNTHLFREHHSTHFFIETPDESPFSILFTSPTSSTSTISKNIYTSNYIFIAQIFTTFLKTLTGKKTHLTPHTFNLFCYKTLSTKIN